MYHDRTHVGYIFTYSKTNLPYSVEHEKCDKSTGDCHRNFPPSPPPTSIVKGRITADETSVKVAFTLEA